MEKGLGLKRPKVGKLQGSSGLKKASDMLFNTLPHFFQKLAWTLRFGVKQPERFKSGPVFTKVPKMWNQAWGLQFETASRQEVRAIVLRKPCKTQ